MAKREVGHDEGIKDLLHLVLLLARGLLVENVILYLEGACKVRAVRLKPHEETPRKLKLVLGGAVMRLLTLEVSD